MTEVDFDSEAAIRNIGEVSSSDTIRLKDMPPAEADLIRRTGEAAARYVPSSSSAPSLEGRVNEIDAEALENQNGRLEALSHQLATMHSQLATATLDNFPHLAWESVKAGLAQEKIINNKINGYVDEIEKHQKDIDTLLDLNAELTKMKEGNLSEKAKDLLNQLKERGIDLWKGEDKLTKEKISELKTLSSQQVDKLRSKIQIIFSTKVQSSMQNINSIMEVLKNIISNNRKLIDRTLTLPR
jgi:hypothetical protein